MKMNEREIKFRAWSPIAKKMTKSFDLEWLKFNTAVPDDFTKEAGFADDLIFMQFTGLKDKNGKLIFEGDIVKYKSLSGFDCGYDNEESFNRNSEKISESIKEVKFVNGEFWPREYANLIEDGYYSWRVFDF